MRLIPTALILIILLSLSGCASVISRSALHPPMLNLHVLPADDLQAIGYTSGQFCQQQCIAYLQADAYSSAEQREITHYYAQRWQQHAPLKTRAMEVKLSYVPSPGNGTSVNYDISLDTTRGDDQVKLQLGTNEQLQESRGTYILIHGFRTNKESLFFVAETMRYEGFNVIMVDLLGHGESTGEFSFSGKPDARLISALIDSIEPWIEEPFYVAGMSMGGTTATHLAFLRDDINSLLLLAPMLEFVDAFAEAGRAYTRAAHIVPLSTLHKSAQYALHDAGTAQEDTAVVSRVDELDIPVLIMGSERDTISPLNKLVELQTDQVQVHAVNPARTHHGMILWNMDDIEVWQDWLSQF